jgi:hypothetical protein
MKRCLRFCLFLMLIAQMSPAQAPSGTPTFLLKDGDRVVFYGDSITEQRLYTSFIEEYALTRFPDRKIEFFNSGVGGDKVSGGWAGLLGGGGGGGADRPAVVAGFVRVSANGNHHHARHERWILQAVR